MDTQDTLRRILRVAPGSIRALARESGVSEALLRAVRDGDRRLTREARDAVADALRTWAARCEGLADALEALDVDPRQGGERE